MNGFGLLAAFLVARNMRSGHSKSRGIGQGMFAAAIIGGIVGAKIPVWLSYGFSPEYFWDGKSLFGGLLGGFIAMNLYKYTWKITIGGFGDRFVIPLCVATGFGKIGCFFNGCCGGREIGDSVYPTQLYESAFQFVLGAIFYYCFRNRIAIGLWFPIYMISYMSMRFAMEFIRNEPVYAFHLTIYQNLAIIFIPVFCAIVFNRRTHLAQSEHSA